MISIDYTLIIVILNFILLLVVLNKILYQPIKNFLSQRQITIANDLSEAEKSKSQAQLILSEQEESYKIASTEIRKMKEQAKKDAAAQSDEIIKQARERERSILIDTEKQLAHEKTKVLNELESSLGDSISLIARKIIGQKIDIELDAKMIENLLAKERSKI